MTIAQVVKMSVTVSDSPIQDYIHLDDHAWPTHEMTPVSKSVNVVTSFFSN